MEDKSSSLWIIIAFILAFLIGLPIALLLLISGSVQESTQQSAACSPSNSAALVVNVDKESLPAVEGFTPEQVAVAAVIMNVAKEMEMGEKGQLIALITAMQESSLGANTSATGSGNDAGVFQQRTQPGWYGTLEQVNDPAYGARIFFEGRTVTESVPNAAGPVGYHIPGLKNIPGWESMQPGDAAQAVQRSNHPRLYDDDIPGAQRLMSALSGIEVQVASTSECPSGEYMNATDLDSLPQFPTPEGCTDQSPIYGAKGPGTLNGNLPASVLCSFPNGQGQLQTRAASSFLAMNEAFRAEFGRDITITDTYRTYDQQVATKAKYSGLAAQPGYSNHGFGLAIDLSGTPEEKRWIQKNGPKYGWWHPLWARPDGSLPESWHYEYGTWLLEDRYASIDPNLIAY